MCGSFKIGCLALYANQKCRSAEWEGGWQQHPVEVEEPKNLACKKFRWDFFSLSQGLGGCICPISQQRCNAGCFSLDEGIQYMRMQGGSDMKFYCQS